MLKKILMITAAATLVGGLLPPAKGGSAQATRVAKASFLVATNGNDAWSGPLPASNAEKSDGPFAPLERARDAARELKAKPPSEGPITVVVRGGKYYRKDTLSLGPKDRGSKDHPVVCMAYQGEKPVLSGGRKLRGWKPYRGKILQCDVPEARASAWKFRQLFLNGERLIRARYPNFDGTALHRAVR